MTLLSITKRMTASTTTRRFTPIGGGPDGHRTHTADADGYLCECGIYKPTWAGLLAHQELRRVAVVFMAPDAVEAAS